MPSDSPASDGPRGSKLAEVRAELVKTRDVAKGLRAGVREPTYDGPRLTDILVRDGQELIRDEASGEWRPLTQADREQERLADAAGAEFIKRYEDAATHGLRFAVSELIKRSLRPCLAHFANLANRIVIALDTRRPDCFSGVGLPSMDVGEIRPGALHHCAFGTDDVVEAGRRMLAWSAWADEGNDIQPFDYGIRYNAWSMSLIAIDERELTAFVRWEPFNWALAAFDKIVGGADDKSPGASETKPMANGGPVDLKGERFRRLHTRFLDGSQRFPYLRYIAATGHNNCPGWPHVPASLSHDTLGLAHKDWLDVTNKRPGTFFVGMNDQWLKIEGQIWHGSFYFDGSVENDNDHDALQRQSEENKEGMRQLELLANEAAGFLGNLPPVHRGVDFPRTPNLWHRWLEAVCASAPVEPARYHCFDVRRVTGNIFHASVILLEQLHTAADKTNATARPLTPVNIDGCDLRPVLVAAEAFLNERRVFDELRKLNDDGAPHILGIARHRLREALAPFSLPGGMFGNAATVGAVNALVTIANDDGADSRVERIEAVIALVRNATGQIQQAATSGPMASKAVIDSLIADFEKHLEGDRPEPVVTADALEAAKRWQVGVEPRRALERSAEEKLRSDLLAAGFTDDEFCDGYNHVRNVEGDDPRAPAFHKAMVEYDRRIKAIGPYRQKRFAVERAEKAGQVQTDEQLPAQQEPPLPPAGYLGLRVDDGRRTISREGFTAVVNLQDSRIKWAIFKKLAQNRDVPVAPEAIIALWDAHGIARKPSDGTVNDAVGKLRASLKAIGLTIVVKRKVGRLLAELPPPADKAKPPRRKKKK